MNPLSYESQLTPDELDALHRALCDPVPNMAQIQASAPPWRDGPYNGTPPSIRTLYSITARLRFECNQAETETTDELFTQAKATLLTQPAYSAASSKAINQVFSLICHEIIRKTLYRDDSKTRIYLLRLLLRHQQLLLQKARFQRLALEQFDKWYMTGPAKEILEKLDVTSYTDRINQLGQAIFGEDWTPDIAQTDGIPGLDPDNPAPIPPATGQPPAPNDQPNNDKPQDNEPPAEQAA